MRGLQAGSTRRARATEGPTVCSVTALQTAALEERTTALCPHAAPAINVGLNGVF